MTGCRQCKLASGHAREAFEAQLSIHKSADANLVNKESPLNYLVLPLHSILLLKFVKEVLQHSLSCSHQLSLVPVALLLGFVVCLASPLF